MGRGGVVRPLLVSGALALGAAVLALGVTTPLGPAFAPPGPPAGYSTITLPPPEASPTGSATASPPPTPAPLPPWHPDAQTVAWVRLGVIALAAAIVLGLLAWALYRAWRAGADAALRRRLEDHAALDVDLEAQALASRRELVRALAALRAGGEVDAVIIECWRRLQRLAAAAGVHRRPSQTSEELTVAVLAGTRANEADLRRLAELYRRAMFGGAGEQATDREAAVDCLERLAHDLEPRHG